MDVDAYRNAPVLRADPIPTPASIDISVDAPPPGDQGSQGSCVGWAVAYTLKSYHERIERGWPLNDTRHVMSPAYVYNQIKVPGGGSYYADAFRLLADQGVSSWAEMPYNWRDDRSQPSAAARVEAANYRIADWGTVLRTTHVVFVQEVKRHVAAGTPVLIAIPVYQDFDDLSPRNPVYDDRSGRKRGYHAAVIIGYDDGRAAFKIVNSWGTKWGIHGYGWIDYEASERLIRSAYVTTDAGAEPEPDPEPEPEPEPESDLAFDNPADPEYEWPYTLFGTSSGDGPYLIEEHIYSVSYEKRVPRGVNAVGGEPPYTYRLTEIPDGMSFNPVTRVLHGSPNIGTARIWKGTYSVTDAAGDTIERDIVYVVVADADPYFDFVMTDQIFQIGVELNPVRMPDLRWTRVTYPENTSGYGRIIGGIRTPGELLPEGYSSGSWNDVWRSPIPGLRVDELYVHNLQPVQLGFITEPTADYLLGIPRETGGFSVTRTVVDGNGDTISMEFAVTVE